MSGIATHTARFVAAVRGTRAAILCTRKTAPGLRSEDVAAVRAGGGDAHRLSLADRVLVKENHLAAARRAGWAQSMADVAARLTGPDGPGVPIGIEVTSLDELREALVPGVDVVLLDNFTPRQCADGVAARDAAYPAGDGPALEASGGITLSNVHEFAESGVERISVGEPTHSARALDLSMKIALDGQQ
jgi:nicotinate-nucleotide pyrophosphorylase (carboxylating)